MIVYLIEEKNSEYNDEYYELLDNNSTLKVYSNYDKAYEKVKKLTEDYFTNPNQPINFSEDYIRAYHSLLLELDLTNDSKHEFDAYGVSIDELSQEKQEYFLNCVMNIFDLYSIREIELED